MVVLDLFVQLEALKRERNAVILAHYYQNPEITLYETYASRPWFY